jgi:hypothetical protein
MRWRTKQVGDTRTRRFLALLPIELDDGTTVWLERVRVDEELAFDGWEGRWWWFRKSCQLAERV